jgi:uncharacterized protein (TIGR00255 family)
VLYSMTGFGSARRGNAGTEVTVEAKSVNSRFLKISVRGPSSLGARELELENLLKRDLRRGTVTLTVRVRHADPAALVAINAEVVRAYQAAFEKLGLSQEAIPTLPGVLGSAGDELLPDAEWELIREATSEAVQRLSAMRATEGAALARVLSDLCDRVEALRAEVRSRAPAVVQEHKHKLEQRLAALLGDATPVDPQLLAREVAFFADRSDVAEEVERLGAHVAQMRALVKAGGEAGRTLEFLAQEMLREANTIGSKSADRELSRAVVGLKSEIERIKEQVANIE